MNPEVTIFMSLSGRWHLWPRRTKWLREQLYPRSDLNVVAMNCDQNKHFSENCVFCSEDIQGWNSFCLFKKSVGRPGLADDHERSESEVYDAMNSIYSEMLRWVKTKYVLILEDDVFCDDRNLISGLLQARTMNSNFLSVSLPYRHRSMSGYYCCWFDDNSFVKENEWDGLYEVKGHGFGCCLMDAEKARMAWQYQGPGRHFDMSFFEAAKFLKMQSFVDFSKRAEHVF